MGNPAKWTDANVKAKSKSPPKKPDKPDTETPQKNPDKPDTKTPQSPPKKPDDTILDFDVNQIDKDHIKFISSADNLLPGNKLKSVEKKSIWPIIYEENKFDNFVEKIGNELGIVPDKITIKNGPSKFTA